MGPLLVQLELSLMLVTCVFGLLKGGAAERVGSLAILAAYVGDNVAVSLNLHHFPTFWVFVSDFALAGALLFIAIRYTSLWLGCAMLLQSISLCSYALAASGDGLHNRSYVILNNSLSLLMLACIIAGTIVSWRKRIRLRKAEGDAAMAQVVPA